MSRYLTPSKTALVLLITIYLEGAVPAASTVPVLSFVVKNVIPHKNRSAAPLELSDFERTLSSLQSVVTGRSVWDLLLNKLWVLDSADNYHSFFDGLTSLQLQPKPPQDPNDPDPPEPETPGTKLSRTSPLGVFVRRAQIEFTRLTFDDSIHLWKDFVAFRQPSYHALRKRNASLSRTSFDANLSDIDDERIREAMYGDLGTSRSGVGFYSTDDIERLLDFQVTEMNKSGKRLPEEIRLRLETMARSVVSIPSHIHYVRYLDAWRAGDYPTALDSLHRFFDYTIQNHDKSHYQYALLNMAQLHENFGCYAEAISAMQETVSTARENKDMVCLNWSLSWLFHLGQEHPEEAKDIQKSGVLGSGKEALAFLRAKAKDSQSWVLLSNTLVAEARLTIRNGDGLAPAVENLVRASHLNLTKRLPEGVGAQLSMESALWVRLGVSELSQTKNELFLQCYQQNASDAERLAAVCKMALPLSTQGRYQEALEMMESVPPEALRNLKTKTAWSLQLGLLKLRRALYRENLAAAEQYLSQLQALPNVETDLRFAVVTFSIKLQMKRGHLTNAMAILDDASKELDQKHGDIANRVRFMVLKGTIWDVAGKSQKAFSVVLRACSIAYEARLLVNLWDAIIALCRILNSLSEFQAARDLLVSCMPQILSSPERESSAHAYSILADAQMGLAGNAGKGSLKRKEEMTKCLEYLDSAFDHFSALEDVSGQCEMLAKRATIMHLNGDYALANDLGAKYLDIKEKNQEEVTA